jgi:hypothetical protein
MLKEGRRKPRVSPSWKACDNRIFPKVRLVKRRLLHSVNFLQEQQREEKMQLPKLAASRIGVVLFTTGLLCFAFLALLLPEQTSFKDYFGWRVSYGGT